MAGTVGADVGAARGAVDMCGDVLQQRAEGLVGLGRTTGHDGRAVEGPFLTAGDTGADEVKVTGRHRGLTADGVGVQGVTAVDDDVPGLHGVGELLDHRVGGLAGLDHDQGATRALQGGDELLGAELGHEVVGLGGGAVVDGDGVPVVGEVPGDIGTHHCQADDTDLCGGICHGRL